jgi:hypothetical protein
MLFSDSRNDDSTVCDELMKPLTKDRQCSFCEYVSETDPSAVGVAKVLISHSWSGEVFRPYRSFAGTI